MNEAAKPLYLPSGRRAAIRRGKGHDLMRAHRAVAGNSDPIAVLFALIAELAEIDGKPIVYEDVLEMALDDVLALEAEVNRPAESANFPEAPALGPAAQPSR